MIKPNPSAPSLTPELSKQARRERSLSQSDVIAATGIQAYRLKMWEARGLAIELADIAKLRDFYEDQGIDLAELAAHVARQHGAPVGASDAAASEPTPSLIQSALGVPRAGFVFASHLSVQTQDSLLERMEANDARIAALTADAFKTVGFFDDISSDTESKAQELICTLAENHLIFRTLQGRGVVSVGKGQPKTLGQYLGVLMQDCPILPLIAADSSVTEEA